MRQDAQKPRYKREKTGNHRERASESTDGRKVTDEVEEREYKEVHPWC